MKKTKDKKTGYLILLAVLFAVPQLAMATTYESVTDVFYNFNWDWVKLQVKSCEQSDCSDGSWIGSDNTSGTWFTNSSFGDLSKTNIQDSRYFQWKAFFITTDTGKTPKLDSITLTTTPITDIAYDKSGYGNDGKLKNFDWTETSGWTTGKYGGGLQFDGVNDYIDCGSGASLNALNDNITIEMWVLRNDNLNSLIAKGSTSSNRPQFYVGGSSNKLYAQFRGNVFTGNTVLDANKWYHIVAVFSESADTMEFFLNGVSDGKKTDATANSVNSVNEPVTIGMRYYSNVYTFFNGTIDDVRIWNRALTPDQTVVMKRVG